VIRPLAPAKMMGFKAEGADGMLGIDLFLFDLRGQEAPGFGIEEKQAPVKEFDGAFKYLPPLVLGVFIALPGRFGDEAIAEILEDFVNLFQKRRFDLVFKDLFRGLYVLIQAAIINPVSTGVLLPSIAFFIIYLRGEGIDMEKTFK